MAQLVVALDFPQARQAIDVAQALRSEISWVKVGLELFTAAGGGLVSDLKALGFKVFLDLKFHDIPNTVHGAVRSAARLGADMLTLHASGGRAMLDAALDAASAEPHRPLLFCVTVLTSLTAEDTALLGRRDVQGLVLDLAGLTAAAGLDGVVCSALEARAVKQRAGDKLACLTPGIRLAAGPGSEAGDQKRVADPAFALEQGSDYLVVGRPITGSPDPAFAARQFLAAMASPGESGRTSRGSQGGSP